MTARGTNQAVGKGSRVSRHILGNEGYAKDKTNAQGMVDISELASGQNGPQTNFEGYVNNASYVRRNIIAVLVDAPAGFQDLPNPELWVSTLKSLIELHPQSIEGLQSTITSDFTETAVGGAGEMQEDLSNVTRARSTPSIGYVEKAGKPINAFYKGWTFNLMMDPITKIPRVLNNAEGNRPTDLLPDYTGATVLFIEPDPTHTRVVQSWLCTNMHPKSPGEEIGSRDLTAGGETVTYNIEFTALTQVGHHVDLMATSWLENLNKSGGINPNLKAPLTGDDESTDINDNISPDVKESETGYAEQRAKG